LQFAAARGEYERAARDHSIQEHSMSEPQHVPSYQAQQPVRPAPYTPRGSSTSWTPILIFTCLALGFCASAVEYERARAVGERGRASVLAADNSVAHGRMEDLGKFLSDSQTHWIRLGSPDHASALHAVVAWNGQSQSGYLFCDQLPALDPGAEYQLWTLASASADPKAVAAIAPQAGVSVYPFHFQSGSLVIGNRIEITAGSRSNSSSAILSGEID
jgi:hypothetical protein